MIILIYNIIYYHIYFILWKINKKLLSWFHIYKKKLYTIITDMCRKQAYDIFLIYFEYNLKL